MSCDGQPEPPQRQLSPDSLPPSPEPPGEQDGQGSNPVLSPSLMAVDELEDDAENTHSDSDNDNPKRSPRRHFQRLLKPPDKDTVPTTGITDTKLRHNIDVIVYKGEYMGLFKGDEMVNGVIMIQDTSTPSPSSNKHRFFCEHHSCSQIPRSKQGILLHHHQFPGHRPLGPDGEDPGTTPPSYKLKTT